jgi:hypothetical protein
MIQPSKSIQIPLIEPNSRQSPRRSILKLQRWKYHPRNLPRHSVADGPLSQVGTYEHCDAHSTKNRCKLNQKPIALSGVEDKQKTDGGADESTAPGDVFIGHNVLARDAGLCPISCRDSCSSISRTHQRIRNLVPRFLRLCWFGPRGCGSEIEGETRGDVWNFGNGTAIGPVSTRWPLVASMFLLALQNDRCSTRRFLADRKDLLIFERVETPNCGFNI